MSHHLACKRIKVRDLGDLIPRRYFERNLEQNQQIATCCRHPEEHEVEAWFSCDAERDKGVPDIYKFFCKCGRTHIRFCAGGDHPGTGAKDHRPFWEAR